MMKQVNVRSAWLGMLSAVVVALALRAQGATKMVDGATYTYEGGTILKVESDAKTISVPAELDEGVPVTAIGGKTTTGTVIGAFQNNTVVMKVTLPDTVDWIGANTFKGCSSLSQVIVPPNVTVINAYTFSRCISLKMVGLPDGLKRIESNAFEYCDSLEALKLPHGLNYIGLCAFENSGLVEIDIPDSVEVIVDGSNVGTFYECRKLVRVHLPAGLKKIVGGMFWRCDNLKEVNIPDGVEMIRESAFSDCPSLEEVVIPASVTALDRFVFNRCKCRLVFLGKPPATLAEANVANVVYPKKYGALWRAQFAIANIGGYVNPSKPVVTVVSSKVRENNPTVLDVIYKVTSTKPTVKVRALAFEDGERSFAKVTRPETFIEGTAANLGDAIAANVGHKLSWQVSSDFKTDLAKMKFEVLAVEDGILPLEFITIPANGTNKKMQLSWNLLTEAQVFDALLWLYADGDDGLLLEEGVLKRASDRYVLSEGIVLASDFEGRMTASMYISGHLVTSVPGGRYYASAVAYVISKMGFSVLSGDELVYANEMTRLGLSPDGLRQYAWRWVEE